MTIKQYGSLTLDLNTVKEFNIKYNYEYPESIIRSGQRYYGNLIGHTLILSLYDGNIVTIDSKWHSQLTKDYQEFTLLKVVKEAFDSVFDNKFEIKKNSKIYELSSTKFWCKIWDNGEFAFAKDSSITGELPRFYAACCLSDWIRYAQHIKDKYLDSLVDPVRVANQVLKSKGLDKEWQILKSNQESFCLDMKGQCRIYFNVDSILKTIRVYSPYFNFDKLITLPTTNFEWVKAIEFALDKYYELNKVNLKLMLGKALKNNGLVAEIVSIFYCEKSLYINVSIPKNKSIQWIKSLDGTIKVCLLTPNNKEAFLSYSTTNVKDWQIIFSDSLAQYKKLTAPKLTEVNIINCLENTIKLPVSGVFSTSSSLVGSLRVTWNDVVIEWILKEESVEVYWVGNCPLFKGAYSKPTTLEEWGKLFKETFGSVTTTIQKINIHKILFEGTNLKSEPTLVDLIKQAFPSYQWVEINSDWVGKNTLIWLQVCINNENVIHFHIVSPNFKDSIYKVSYSSNIFTKENLTNYSNWEQWLDDLIKVNQNLKDLEQSPNLVVKEIKKHS